MQLLLLTMKEKGNEDEEKYLLFIQSETPAGLQASDLRGNSLYCSIHPCLIHLMELLNGTQAIGWLSTEVEITSLITRYSAALIISTVLKKSPPRRVSSDLF